MSIETVLAFCGVALLAYVTPGPDWFVVMPAAVTSRRTGWIAACGVQCGLLVHMSAVGVAAVILASATAFTLLKWIGAVYLVYHSIRALLASRRQSQHPVQGADDTDVASRTTGLRVWRRAFTANVINPKAALFFVAVLPQFVTPAGPVAAQIVGLGLLDVAHGAARWAVFVLGVHRLCAVMGGVRARTVTDRFAGTALIGLGGILATAPRRT